MNEAEELARRWLVLWEDYLSALYADPGAAELLRRWTAALPSHDRAADAEAGQPGSPARAAPAAGASVERAGAVAELSRRLADVERRLSLLERSGGDARGHRRRNPGSRG